MLKAVYFIENYCSKNDGFATFEKKAAVDQINNLYWDLNKAKTKISFLESQNDLAEREIKRLREELRILRSR